MTPSGSSESSQGAPAASGWGIYEIARQPDPYPRWAELREATPVLDAGDGVFFVTSWELVDAVVRDPALHAGSGVAESMSVRGLDYDPTALWLMSLDGPPHVRARGLVRREFTARRVEALGGMIAECAARLVDDFVEAARRAPADFVARVAQRLPSEVIRHLFAIAPGTWEREVHALFADPSGDSGDPGELIGALGRFFDAHRDDAGEGLLAQLRRPDEDGEQLSPEEVVSNAVLLATAAVDTTTGLIANALLCLLETPDVRTALAATPTLVGDVVEETLRYEPPALSCSRYAPVALELGGVAIPAGSHLLLSIGAANRDPAKYDEPDRFRLGRDWTGLLTFGGGRHFCLGAALARLEGRAVIERLVPHLERLELATPVAWRTDNPTVRVPAELWIRARG